MGWIILIIVGFLLTIAAFIIDDHVPFTNAGEISFITGIVLFLIGWICFFAIPIRGYMDVESIQWRWTVDIYTFQPVNENHNTGHYSTRYDVENAVNSSIPGEAYNVSTTIHSGSKDVVVREWKDSNGKVQKETRRENYYYASYSYTIDKWVKTAESVTSGNDKSPYEDRPYETNVPCVIGNCKCGVGRSEEYFVHGIVEQKYETFAISKSDWERLSSNDEFSYSKYRFGDEIWGLQIAR